MKKYGDASKLELLRGREAGVLNENFRRTGKFAVSDFSEDELKNLNDELEVARRADAAESEVQEKQDRAVAKATADAKSDDE